MNLEDLDLSTLIALKEFYGRYKIEPGVIGGYYNPNEEFKVDGYEAAKRYNMVDAVISKKLLEFDQMLFDTPVIVSSQNMRR